MNFTTNRCMAAVYHGKELVRCARTPIQDSAYCWQHHRLAERFGGAQALMEFLQRATGARQ